MNPNRYTTQRVTRTCNDGWTSAVSYLAPETCSAESFEEVPVETQLVLQVSASAVAHAPPMSDVWRAEQECKSLAEIYERDNPQSWQPWFVPGP